MGALWPWVCVALLGGLVGLTELVSRYRDDPAAAIGGISSWLYIGLNALASLGALALLESELSAAIRPEELIGRVLLAGTVAAAFFRSSLFVFKIGDSDVQVGPGLILQVLLDVIDRAVDRKRAEERAEEIGSVMQGIDFEKACLSLPSMCFALMQNLTPDEQIQVGEQITILQASDMSARSKTLALGLLLMNLVGKRTLNAAVNALGKEIRSD